MTRRGGKKFVRASHFPPTPAGAGFGTCRPERIRGRLPWRHRASPSATLHETVKLTDANKLMQEHGSVKNFFTNFFGRSAITLLRRLSCLQSRTEAGNKPVINRRGFSLPAAPIHPYIKYKTQVDEKTSCHNFIVTGWTAFVVLHGEAIQISRR
jgi:hypothetical protein